MRLLAAMLMIASVAGAQSYDAAVVTPWVGTGAPGDAYRPKLGSEYPSCDWTDITAQATDQIVPSPNAYTLQVRCPGDVMGMIKDDADYAVIWVEQAVEEPPVGPQQEARWTLPWVMQHVRGLLQVLSPATAEAQSKKPPERTKHDKAKHVAPPAAERNALRNALRALGYTSAQANALVRSGVARQVIAEDIVAAQKLAQRAQ